MARPETPESILLHKGSPEELNEAEEALYKLLVPENKKRAIKIEEFSDLYAADAIAADDAFVKRQKAKNEQSRDDAVRTGKLRGDLFEAIINTQIAESDWMGPDADIIVPSEYDDFRNGVDSIVEFDREEGGSSHLALAIDVTESPMQMLEKFKKIKVSIESGALSQVKYFKSKNFRGELNYVPRVVVGAGRETVEGIAHLILQFKRLQATVARNRRENKEASVSQKATEELAKVRQEIAGHPLQGMLLAEIKAQLESFRDYAHSIKKDAMADHYSQVLALIDAVTEAKGKAVGSDEKSKDDLIYRTITERAERFSEKLDASFDRSTTREVK